MAKTSRIIHRLLGSLQIDKNYRVSYEKNIQRKIMITEITKWPFDIVYFYFSLSVLKTYFLKQKEKKIYFFFPEKQTYFLHIFKNFLIIATPKK